MKRVLPFFAMVVGYGVSAIDAAFAGLKTEPPPVDPVDWMDKAFQREFRRNQNWNEFVDKLWSNEDES